MVLFRGPLIEAVPLFRKVPGSADFSPRGAEAHDEKKDDRKVIFFLSFGLDALQHALLDHRLGNLHEAGDVGALHVVDVAVGLPEGVPLSADRFAEGEVHRFGHQGDRSGSRAGNSPT